MPILTTRKIAKSFYTQMNDFKESALGTPEK